MIRTPVALALLALVAQPVSAQRGDYPPNMTGAQERVYKKAGDVELKLYIYQPDDHKSDDRRPAIIFFFGGGWTNGSPEQFAPHSKYLASRGMVAIVADYRVASRHQVKAVDCVRDAKSAVRWVRAHAKELGIDPDRIAAAGGSAGGHLAAATATLTEFDEPSEDAAVSSRPNAVVLFNPVLSFDPKVADPTEPRIANFKMARLGVEPPRLSPAEHIDAKTPPALLMVGSKDFLIGGDRQFMDRMKAAGARCDFDLYEGRTHGFFNYRQNGTPDFIKTTESMDRFLTSLGYLKGEPNVQEIFLPTSNKNR
jgi:acetyl esterase/lipase